MTGVQTCALPILQVDDNHRIYAARFNERLLGTLIHLRDLGNTVIVVEHDEDAIRAADHVIDIGPGAGVHGGEVVAEGPLEAIMAVPESLTGQYMSGKRKIEVPKKRVPANPEKVLKLTGARGNNLKDVTLTLPVGLFTCITGVSGSGKSTLVNRMLGEDRVIVYDQPGTTRDSIYIPFERNDEKYKIGRASCRERV